MTDEQIKAKIMKQWLEYANLYREKSPTTAKILIGKSGNVAKFIGLTIQKTRADMLKEVKQIKVEKCGLCGRTNAYSKNLVKFICAKCHQIGCYDFYNKGRADTLDRITKLDDGAVSRCRCGNSWDGLRDKCLECGGTDMTYEFDIKQKSWEELKSLQGDKSDSR